MCSRADGATVFVCEYVCVSVILFLRVQMGSVGACMVTFCLFCNACECVSCMGKPWWFSPALASITVDGVDKCNDRVRTSNRPDSATEKSISYCCQHTSRLLSSLLSVCYSYFSLWSIPLLVFYAFASLLSSPLLSG